MKDHPMTPYIKEQPEALAALLADRKEAAADFVALFTKADPDRIYLFGSGTSLNAAELAAPFMAEMLGVEVTCLAASQITEQPIYGQRPLFCAISQGGTSANTIKAIEMYRHSPMLVITSKPNSTMGTKFPEYHTLLRCGEEKAGPKTKGYTCTILTFYLYALEAALATERLEQKDYEAIIEGLEEAVAKLPANIERTFLWFESQKDALKDIETCVVFGKGVGRHVATESALKMLETLQIPAMHYEFEEYLHGPIMVGDEHLLLLGLIPQDEDKERALDLVKFFDQKVTKTAIALLDEADKDLPNALVLDLPRDKYLAVFAQALPSQVIAATLPELRGGAGFDDDYFMEIDAVVGTKDRSGNQE